MRASLSRNSGGRWCSHTYERIGSASRSQRLGEGGACDSTHQLGEALRVTSPVCTEIGAAPEVGVTAIVTLRTESEEPKSELARVRRHEST